MASIEWLQHPEIALIGRWLLTLTFLASAIRKFQNIQGFISTVLDYQILPVFWARKFAIMLPWIEMGLGVLLGVGLFTQVTTSLSLVLLLIFVVAIGRNLFRGRTDLDCGCGVGRHRQKISTKLLLRDFLLMLISFHLILSGPGNWALDNQLDEMPIRVVLNDVAFPLIISVGGILLLYRLLKQLMRFVQLNDRP